jgi:CBS domain-containing protein
MDSSVQELNKYTQHGKLYVEEAVLTKVLISDAIHFFPETNIVDAASVLSRSKITGAAVIDHEKNLLGYISEKDCLESMFVNSYDPTYLGTVKQYMSTDLINVTLGDNIYAIIDLFIRNPFQAYPVKNKDGAFLGVIRRSNILKLLIDIQSNVRLF